MDKNIKALRGRLSRGEISADEYERILSLITDDANAPWRSESPTSADISTVLVELPRTLVEIAGHGFQSFKARVRLTPTDLVIDDRAFPNADISSVASDSWFSMISVVPTSQGAMVRVRMLDRTSILIANRVLFADRAQQAILDLGAKVGELTYQRRLNVLADRVRSDAGGVQIGSDHSGKPVKLFRDATLEYEGQRVSLKTAQTLRIGWDDHRLTSRVSNPNVVTVSPRKVGVDFALLREIPLGFRNDILRFDIDDLFVDRDVTMGLLRWLALPESRL